MPRNRSGGPNVDWVGIVVRTDDGNVHAVELHADATNLVTADLIIDQYSRDKMMNFPISAIIRGKGRYWVEGTKMGPPSRGTHEITGTHAIEGEVL